MHFNSATRALALLAACSTRAQAAPLTLWHGSPTTHVDAGGVPVATNVPRGTTSSFRAEVRHRLYSSSQDGSGAAPLNASLGKRASGVDGVTFGSYWFTPASAGGQAVQVLIDTGSADLWLLSPSLPSPVTSGQMLYAPDISRSASEIAASFDITYGTGSNGASGGVHRDDFGLGNVVVSHMAIGSASKLSGVAPGTFKSGILGLSFQSGNSVKPNAQPTFMERLIGDRAGSGTTQLDEPVFVANFKMGGGGFIEFGRVDSSLYTGPLATIQARNGSSDKYPGSWSYEGVTYRSNGRTLGSFDIVFDTGGPGTSGPIEIVRAYYAQVPGARDVHGDGSQWSVACTAAMPDLEFGFVDVNGKDVTGRIPGSKMIQNQGGACTGWLVKENSPSRGLVGDAFFDSNVVVFDQAKATIAFAPQLGA